MLHFLAGLPRSGSTLISALLNQNPRIFANTTNDLVELFAHAKNSWTNLDAFRAQGLENVLPRIKKSLKGLLSGFYYEDFIKGKIVIDKSRAWPTYIEALEEVLERPIKIICPMRDIKEIVASFENLRRKNPLTIPVWNNCTPIEAQTIFGRTKALLAPDGTIGSALRSIQDACDRGLQNRFCFVEYKHLIETPRLVMTNICLFLGVDPYELDFKNIVGPDTSREVDVWGVEYHKIRSKMDQNHSKWQEILPEEVGKWIDDNIRG